MTVQYRYGCLLVIKDVDGIVHQCNCLTVKPHGLSEKISKTYSWGDLLQSHSPFYHYVWEKRIDIDTRTGRTKVKVE